MRRSGVRSSCRPPTFAHRPIELSFGWRANLRAKVVRRSPKGEGGPHRSLSMPQIRRIGVLTGGGDAPGLNAVIRAVVKSACNTGIEVLGIEDSFDGLIEPGRTRVLAPKDVTGILRLGGTILGTTNRGNPFAYPVSTSDGNGRLLDARHRELSQVRTRCARRHRRRRHVGDCAPAVQEGHSDRRRAENNRQRHRRHCRAASGSTRP